MVRVDLITGFLGAGKTTFIRRYTHYLRKRGVVVRIIENEFGPLGVDSRFLSGEAGIDDLTGCCMCCDGKSRFRSLLLSAAETGCHRVLVEPSGIYDAAGFFEIMDSDAVRSVCEIGSILTIADARWDDTLSPASRYLLAGQLLSAGAVIVSKSQCHSPKEIAFTRERLAALAKEFGGDLPILMEKPWAEYTGEDFAALERCGCRRMNMPAAFAGHRARYDSCTLGGRCLGEEDLRDRIGFIFSDPAYGRVMRVKGHMRDTEGHVYELNCTPSDRSIRPSGLKKGTCVIIGQGLNEARLEAAFLPG